MLPLKKLVVNGRLIRRLLFSNPGLWGRIKVVVSATTADRLRSVHFLDGRFCYHEPTVKNPKGPQP